MYKQAFVEFRIVDAGSTGDIMAVDPSAKGCSLHLNKVGVRSVDRQRAGGVNKVTSESLRVHRGAREKEVCTVKRIIGSRASTHPVRTHEGPAHVRLAITIGLN